MSKTISFILCFLLFLSCEQKQNKETPVFIVSEFNRNIENKIAEALKENPESELLEEIKLYDYPKGKINFVFSENGKIYFYNEEMWDILCPVGLDKLKPQKRTLDWDSLHSISFNEIKNLLEKSKNKKEYRNSRGELYPLSFAFEKDSVSGFDIHQLLSDIDSLGYERYVVRRIADFESKCIQK